MENVIPLFLWMWASIHSWHFYEIVCNTCVPRKCDSVVHFFFPGKNQNGSMISLHILQRNHTFIVLSCFNPLAQRNHDSVVYFFPHKKNIMVSWFHCTKGGAKNLHNNCCAKILHRFLCKEITMPNAFQGGVILEFWGIVGTNSKTYLGEWQLPLCKNKKNNKDMLLFGVW